nr:hypothetical protein [Oceanococcus sp. HetDA_MAG_MS8]
MDYTSILAAIDYADAVAGIAAVFLGIVGFNLAWSGGKKVVGLVKHI